MLFFLGRVVSVFMCAIGAHDWKFVCSVNNPSSVEVCHRCARCKRVRFVSVASYLDW